MKWFVVEKWYAAGRPDKLFFWCESMTLWLEPDHKLYYVNRFTQSEPVKPKLHGAIIRYWFMSPRSIKGQYNRHYAYAQIL